MFVILGSHRKRTRNLDIVPFEGREGPSDVAVEGKQPKSKKQCASRHGLPIVKSRASSPHYVEAIQKFNTAQRKAVEEMRFGRFLELQIKLFLTELSYALLNSYNPMNSKLSLKDGLMAKDAEKVLYPASIKAMLNCEDGGEWFKRFFMVLNEELDNGGFCQGRIEVHYMPATTVSAPSVGDVQGPYASDPEVQPQHQTPIQVELECSASSKV
nr:uncharacterized protein LOC109167340 [Ipomoea batatas]